MKDYQKVAETGSWDEKLAFYEKYRVVPGRWLHSVIKGRLPKTDTPQISIPTMVAVRIVPKGQEVTRPVARPSEEDDPGYVWVETMSGLNNKETRSGLFHSQVEELLHSLWGYPSSEGDYATGDCLVLRLDLKYSKKEIERQIDDLLDKWKPKKQDRSRKEKWKYYLIVYDLMKKKPTLSYPKIADMLREAYPKAKKPFNERTCLNWHKQARRLIDEEGYKHYI